MQYLNFCVALLDFLVCILFIYVAHISKRKIDRITYVILAILEISNFALLII